MIVSVYLCVKGLLLKAKRLLTLFFLIFVVAGSFSLFAEEDAPIAVSKPVYRALGDQVFSIEVGLYIPFGFTDFTPNDGTWAYDSNLTVGGSGYLGYSIYLNNNIRVGLEFGGTFCASPNSNFFFQVPIMVLGVYEFHLGERWSIPIYLSTGVSITSFIGETRADYILKGGVGFNFNLNVDWSFGLKYVYSINPQIYSNDSSLNMTGHFSDLSIAVNYHF